MKHWRPSFGSGSSADRGRREAAGLRHGRVVTAPPASRGQSLGLGQGRHCPCAGRCEKYPALCFDFPNGRRAAGSSARSDVTNLARASGIATTVTSCSKRSFKDGTTLKIVSARPP